MSCISPFLYLATVTKPFALLMGEYSLPYDSFLSFPVGNALRGIPHFSPHQWVCQFFHILLFKIEGWVNV